MKLVSQIISARSSSMSIIDCKERTSRPNINFFEFWLNYIEYYLNSIFIIVSNHALVSVCSICYNNTIFFGCEFWRIIILLELLNLLVFHLDVLFPLKIGHFHTTIINNRRFFVIFRILFKHLYFWFLIFNPFN